MLKVTFVAETAESLSIRINRQSKTTLRTRTFWKYLHRAFGFFPLSGFVFQSCSVLRVPRGEVSSALNVLSSPKALEFHGCSLRSIGGTYPCFDAPFGLYAEVMRSEGAVADGLEEGAVEGAPGPKLDHRKIVGN